MRGALYPHGRSTAPGVSPCYVSTVRWRAAVVVGERRRPSGVRALGLVALPVGALPVLLMWLACSVPSLNEFGKACTDRCPSGLPCVAHVCGGSLPESGAPPIDASCSSSSTADPCNALPMFTGSQRVDGYGDDFCGVPQFIFNPLHGQPTNNPGGNDLGLNFDAGVQVAWSGDASAAFHVFVHVPKWPVATIGPALFEGDAVEVLVAGSASDLTGDVEGDPGTMHIIVAPPARRRRYRQRARLRHQRQL